MRPHSHTLLDPATLAAALADLATVSALLARLPDADALDPSSLASWPSDPGRLPGLCPRGPRERPVWSCHALVRAVAGEGGLSLAWAVTDGDYAGWSNHSWLAHLWGRTRLVLDVYPVAALGGPALHDASAPFVSRLYAPRAYGAGDVAQFDGEAAVAAEVWARDADRDGHHALTTSRVAA